jgi:hypothetical protein
MSMRHALLAVAAALCIMLQPVRAETLSPGVLEASPGSGLALEVIEISGTLVGINAETREVILGLGDGQTMSFVAGPEVQNFAQLELGDLVEIEHVRALLLELRQGNTEEPWRIDDDRTIRAAPGEKPAGATGHVVRALVEVIAVQPERSMVTVRGPRNTVELRIPDSERLAGIAVGDRIEATYIEAGAISVRSPDKAQ